jgi:YidC/Oxa1 family membrane protein insertase
MNIGDIILNPFVTVLVLLYKLIGFLPELAPGQTVVLAIALFTILIRLLTFPLTRQQQRSMKKTQELQPELEKLKKKYANNREKLSQAQMELYKKAGINPLGGCLPLLIQLPIIFGLYSAITTSLGGSPLQLINLHGRILIPSLQSEIPLQNQFLWLNLAQPDPTPILAVLVVVTTFLQQRLITPPTSGDGQAAAMSQSMTYVMPLMFGWIAFTLASGLSIYFIVSNVIGIFQYAAMGRVDLRSLIGRRKPTEKSKASKKGKKNTPERTP